MLNQDQGRTGLKNRTRAIEAADFLKSHFKEIPGIGLITGTGLSNIIDTVKDRVELDYSQIPHFPVSTVESHTGKLVFGKIQKKAVLIMQGRFHLYEGYSPGQVTFPIRVMQELGIQTLILSNAAGGINLDFKAGQIMVINDHINLTGQNPLTGPNNDQWGVRFPDMIQVYDPGLRQICLDTARKLEITLQTGVYAGLCGPSLETPSETRFLKTIGADAVGFSTVMEAIAGTHAGMKILGLSLITNINNPDRPAPTTLESVLKTADLAVPAFTQLLHQVLVNIPG